MDLQLEKMELIELIINTKKDSIITKLRKVIDKDNNLILSSEEYKIIDERRENHLNRTSNSYSWQQFKENMQSAKK